MSFIRIVFYAFIHCPSVYSLSHYVNSFTHASGIPCVDGVISEIFDCVVVCVYVSIYVCAHAHGLSYKHQTWYPYTLLNDFGMHGPRRQKVKGQGHRVMKCATGSCMHVGMTACVSSLRLMNDRV